MCRQMVAGKVFASREAVAVSEGESQLCLALSNTLTWLPRERPLLCRPAMHMRPGVLIEQRALAQLGSEGRNSTPGTLSGPDRCRPADKL